MTIIGSGLTGTTAVHFGSSSAPFTTVSDSQITALAPSGTGSVPVTVTTPAGTSNALTYGYINAPLITALSPTQGPTSGGNTVTITGTGLSGATSVLFGTHATTITANTATQITATAPAAAAQSVTVTVTTTAGTSNPLPYFYITAPSITGIDPAMGPTGGANAVTVFGSGLALTSAVRFRPAAATGVTANSDSQITATAPPGTGTVLVTATTPGGTSAVRLGNGYYTYVPPPVITSLPPRGRHPAQTTSWSGAATSPTPTQYSSESPRRPSQLSPTPWSSPPHRPAPSARPPSTRRAAQATAPHSNTSHSPSRPPSTHGTDIVPARPPTPCLTDQTACRCYGVGLGDVATQVHGPVSRACEVPPPRDDVGRWEGPATCG